MFGAWIIAGVHLLWQVVCCVFIGGSWWFVVFACLLLVALAMVDLYRVMLRA